MIPSDTALSRDDRRDGAGAAYTGRDLGGLDAEAPERLAALRLDRDDAAVARGHREEIAVDGDRQRYKNRTEPMLWLQTGRTVIGAMIGSSGFGLGLFLAEERRGSSCRPSRSSSSRRRDERERRSAAPIGEGRAVVATVTSAASAALAAGCTPSTLSLASTRRAIVDLRIHRAPCLLVCGLGVVGLALRPAGCRRDGRRRGRRTPASSMPSSCFSASSYFFCVEQQAGQAQAGDRRGTPLRCALSATQARLAWAVVELALLGGRARGDAGRPAAVKAGARIARLHVGEDPRRDWSASRRLRRAIHLVEERARLAALVTLVDVPAVPGREAADESTRAPT